MKRRAAIEPAIGRLKSDHRLSRNDLKGRQGNEADVILAAAGYNFDKLLAWFYCAWIILGGSVELKQQNTWANQCHDIK